MATIFEIKRIYDKPNDSDGYRVLVDRLWPRGISKQNASLDEWNKDITPSTELRIWFGHKADNFKEFSTLYKAELSKNEAVNHFKTLSQTHPKITLLYAAHDPKINHAIVLRDYLQKQLSA